MLTIRLKRRDQERLAFKYVRRKKIKRFAANFGTTLIDYESLKITSKANGLHITRFPITFKTLNPFVLLRRKGVPIGSVKFIEDERSTGSYMSTYKVMKQLTILGLRSAHYYYIKQLV